MKKNIIIILGIIILAIILVVLIYFTINFTSLKTSQETQSPKEILDVMYTDSNNNARYALYNVDTKKLEDLFTRKNYKTSDFLIEKKNNKLYYSDSQDNINEIFQVDLKTNKETNLFHKIQFKVNSGKADIFDISNNILVFRTLADKNSGREALGKFNLDTKEMDIFDKFDNDSDVLNFYFKKINKTIYTVERSIKDFIANYDHKIFTHNIYKCDINGNDRELIYSTKKNIHDIAVNNSGDKILYDATTFEDGKAVNKVYLLDLGNETEEVILEPNKNFEEINLDLVTKARFSADENGFYFLATTTDSNTLSNSPGFALNKAREIYYYNFNDKNVKLIYENKDALINDYKINLD